MRRVAGNAYRHADADIFVARRWYYSYSRAWCQLLLWQYVYVNNEQTKEKALGFKYKNIGAVLTNVWSLTHIYIFSNSSFHMRNMHVYVYVYDNVYLYL